MEEAELTVSERFVWYDRKPDISKQAFIVEWIVGRERSIQETCEHFHVYPKFVLKCLERYYTPSNRHVTLMSRA